LNSTRSWRSLLFIVCSMLVLSSGISSILNDHYSEMGTSTVEGEAQVGSRGAGRGDSIYVDAENGDDENGDGSEGDPYATIQKGVDSASRGDTIVVNPGNYTENVKVGKSVHIRSSTGDWARHNVTSPDASDHTFEVTADFVNISGFRITGTGGGFKSGVFLSSVNGCNLSWNNITSNAKGIFVENSGSVVIGDCIIESSGTDGITLANSDHCELTSNTISGNSNGIYAYGSSGNLVSGNELRDNYIGIQFTDADDNLITGNTVDSNRNWGMYIYSNSDGNTIEGNTIRNNTNYGLYLQFITDSTLDNNTLQGNGYDLGISGYQLSHYYHDISDTNSVSGREDDRGGRGGAPIYYWRDIHTGTIPEDAGFVCLVECSGITLENLTLGGNSHGILLVDSDSCTIRYNDIRGVKETAIRLDHSSEFNIITNNDVLENGYTAEGIVLDSSSHNTISENMVKRYYYGVSLEASSGCTISDNTMNENRYGCYLLGSDHNDIDGNFAGWNFLEGFFLTSSDSNNITDNTAQSNNQNGISLYSSNYNKVTDNTAKDNTGFDIFFSKHAAYSYGMYDNTIENNIGSGDRPIMYVNSMEHIHDEVYSELILADADHSLIENVEVIGSDHKNNNGILVFGTDHTEFRDVTSSDNEFGMTLSFSTQNTITDSTFESNRDSGIRLYESSHENTVTGNLIESNSGDGMFLYQSSDCIITDNTLGSNGNRGLILTFANDNEITSNIMRSNTNRGIDLLSSNGNQISNNFFDNDLNARDNGDNQWNVEKSPGDNIIGGDYLGGNYWSDYSGNDTDKDGLGDMETPYTSSGMISKGGDELPLVYPIISLSVRKTADLEKVIPGSHVNYTINITNIWSDNVTNITIHENFDENTSFHSSTQSPYQNNDTWKVSSLEVNESHEFNITVKVAEDLPDGTLIFNVVSASYDQGNTVTANTTSTIIAPKLFIAISDIPDPVKIGEVLNYTLRVSNIGHAPATNVTVREQLDTNLIINTSTPIPSYQLDHRYWVFDVINATSQRMINITTTVNGSLSHEQNLLSSVRVSCEECPVHIMDSELTWAYKDEPPIPIINITIDPFQQRVEPGTIVNITGNITIEPTGDIQKATIYLDGEEIGPLSFQGNGFSVDLPLPENLSEGNHTVRVNVTLETGETASENITILYEREPAHVNRTITITVDPYDEEIPGDLKVTISGSIDISPNGTISDFRMPIKSGSGFRTNSRHNRTGFQVNISFMNQSPNAMIHGYRNFTIEVILETGEFATSDVTLFYDITKRIIISVDPVEVEYGKTSHAMVSMNVTTDPSVPIEEIEVKLNGKVVSSSTPDNNASSMTFASRFPLPSDLEPGNHTIWIKVTLTNGQYHQASITLEYGPEEDEGDEDRHTLFLAGVFLMFLFLIIVIIVLMGKAGKMKGPPYIGRIKEPEPGMDDAVAGESSKKDDENDGKGDGDEVTDSEMKD